MEEPVIKSLVRRVKDLQDEDTPITLLAVCPNSDAVLEAAIEASEAIGRTIPIEPSSGRNTRTIPGPLAAQRPYSGLATG